VSERERAKEIGEKKIKNLPKKSAKEAKLVFFQSVLID
jgi:hypothetical protein